MKNINLRIVGLVAIFATCILVSCLGDIEDAPVTESVLTNEQYFNLYCTGSDNVWQRKSGGITFSDDVYDLLFTENGQATEFYIDGSNPWYLNFTVSSFVSNNIAFVPDSTYLSGTITGPDSTAVTWSINKENGNMTVTRQNQSVVFELEE